MSGVSELLFRHDTTDCFTETCLNHEQYGSLIAPYAENDDLEEFFLGAFASLADIRKEGVVLRSNEETVEFKNIKAEERVYPAQQVEISLPHTLYANGDSRLYMELNGVVSGLTSPASSAVSMNGSVSPTHGRVGRFTLEERRQLLQRFQQKRTQRNFNKKIKYACRKSLADKRPRVRGRFARNDESTEHSSRTNGHKLEDDDEADTTMGEEDEFLMNQSSSGDFLDLLELPVKLERLEP
ncbi:unnamed protein product [Sphagnum troendelagicum]|uniref:CCT domain-containing protein n=1 Tax=Sphagnum troendelagicum TaxID=128251 RepID=A0ABP0TNF0_9BRYO